MNDTLKQPYNKFYTPLPMADAEQEIENCHRRFIEWLEKPERKLMLRYRVFAANRQKGDVGD